MGEVQRLAARSFFRDGEILIQHILGRKAGLVHLGPVPYSFELIEADLLPFELNDEKRGIFHGVEKDQWGRPRAYHLLRKAPDTGIAFLLKPSAKDIKRVPAERISHLKFTRRIKQTRGVSVFHGVAHRLDDIKDYEESERIAARIAASFSAYIKKGTDFDPTSAVEAGAGKRTMEFESGMIFDDLLPGEEIGTIDTNRPNQGLQEFRNSQLRAIASGTGTNYSSISKDYNGTYSAQRQELVESVPGYARPRAYFVSTFLQPTYENFITASVLSGQLIIPPGVDPATLTEAEWIAPPTSWIDPKKEIEADSLAVKARFKTRAAVIRERTGKEPDIVKEQIRIEQAEETAAGILDDPGAPAAVDDPANSLPKTTETTARSEAA